MQSTPDDDQRNVRKHSGQFWEIHPSIQTWNQDTHQETSKDLNKIV